MKKKFGTYKVVFFPLPPLQPNTTPKSSPGMVYLECLHMKKLVGTTLVHNSHIFHLYHLRSPG